MTKQQIIQAMAGGMKSLRLPDGYDRNGSHDEGKYVEYEWSLQNIIHERDEWKIVALATAAYEALPQDIKDKVEGG